MKIRTLLALSCAVLAVSACHSTGGSFCNKLQDCNDLKGETVDDCTQNVNKGIDNLTSSQQSDCEKDLNNCEGESSCADFANCLGKISTCPGVNF